jgi:putative exporter of polyketide antibiotics
VPQRWAPTCGTSSFFRNNQARAAMADMFGSAPSPGSLAAMTRKTAGLIAPALDAIVKALLAAEVAHFDAN